MKYMCITVKAEPIDPVAPVQVVVDGRSLVDSPDQVRGDAFELRGPDRLDGQRPETVRVVLRRQPLTAEQIADWIRQDVRSAADRAGVHIDDAELDNQAARLARRATSPFRIFRRS